MICKYFGKKVVREKRKKDIWQEDLLVSYFRWPVSVADFVAKKNVIFILFIRFVKILILLYIICMFFMEFIISGNASYTYLFVFISPLDNLENRRNIYMAHFPGMV